MRAVYKYQLEVGQNTVQVPETGTPLYVGLDPDGILCVWIDIPNTDATMISHAYIVAGTGHPVHSRAIHVGSTRQGVRLARVQTVRAGDDMTNKSHVTMEANVCVVCAETFDTGAILLDRQLRERFESRTTTGWGMCPHHEALKDDGYVALVACDESKSGRLSNGNVDPGKAWRTGTVAHLRRAVFADVFNVPVPDMMVCFCDDNVIEALVKMEHREDT